MSCEFPTVEPMILDCVNECVCCERERHCFNIVLNYLGEGLVICKSCIDRICQLAEAHRDEEE